MPALEESIRIGGLDIENRLYRAPLLECAGNGPDAPERLREHLEPAAAAGAGLVCQGATVVTADGGCAAPQMTRVHDDAFVDSLAPVPDAVQDHGGTVFAQLAHGGLRSLEVWHAGARKDGPAVEQLAVSRPPFPLRALDRLGFLGLQHRVLTSAEIYDLAGTFGAAAERVIESGYDGIHISAANMSLVQQFLSPYYNNRDDEFGGSRAARIRFLELIHDEIRSRVGEVPLITKVPCETGAPPFARPRIEREDAVAIATHLADYGYDGVVPVVCSTFWDASIIRGAYPARAWNDDRFTAGYAAAFGGRLRARLVALLTHIETARVSYDGPWNVDLCRSVRRTVDVPVLCEGGIRTRTHIDEILGASGEQAADLVGLGRPFYAEPRLPAILLQDSDASVACGSCNNCTVPQVTGADGVCRTPSVMAQRGARERAGRYETE